MNNLNNVLKVILNKVNEIESDLRSEFDKTKMVDDNIDEIKELLIDCLEETEEEE